MPEGFVPRIPRPALALLLFQLALALAWYTSDRNLDERGAWRMLSTRAWSDCQGGFLVDGKPEPAPTSWSEALSRANPRVLRTLARPWCDAGHAVFADIQCVDYVSTLRRPIEPTTPLCPAP